MTWTARGCVGSSLPAVAIQFICACSQPLAADIPSAADLQLKTRAEERPGDPPLPPPTRSETVLKRDEWMLMPPSTPTIPISPSRGTPMDEDPMDGYGEPSSNARTTGGSVDFFSSLGSERKKKPQPDRPDPDKVRPPPPLTSYPIPNADICIYLRGSPTSRTRSSTRRSKKAGASTTSPTHRARRSSPAGRARSGA